VYNPICSGGLSEYYIQRDPVYRDIAAIFGAFVLRINVYPYKGPPCKAYRFCIVPCGNIAFYFVYIRQQSFGVKRAQHELAVSAVCAAGNYAHNGFNLRDMQLRYKTVPSARQEKKNGIVLGRRTCRIASYYDRSAGNVYVQIRPGACGNERALGFLSFMFDSALY